MHFRLLLLFAAATYITSAFSANLNPFIPNIREELKKVKIELVEDPSTSWPGQVFSAKSEAFKKDYPNGTYHFRLRNSSQKKFFFNNIAYLKAQKSLLHIIIDGSVKEASIILPVMDTVIEADNLDDFQFYLGSSDTQNFANYYFFIKTGDPQRKIHIKARGQIYASLPKIFNLMEGSTAKKITPIKFADFFFKHTVGQKIIPKDKLSLGNLNTEDKDHPTRPHQISRAIDTIIALEQGIKYFTSVAATGSGKSHEICMLAELLTPEKILIITPKVNLVNQIKTTAERFYPHLNISDINSHNQNFKQYILSNSDKDITIGTLQGFTINYKDAEDILQYFDTIIIDEAHNLLSKEYSEMVQFVKNYGNKRLKLFLFTATPERLYEHKKTKLTSVYQLTDEADLPDPYITPFNFFKAIKARVNVAFQIFHLLNLIPPEDRWAVGSEFAEAAVQKDISQEKFHSVVLDFYLHGFVSIDPNAEDKPLFGKKAIVFGAGIAHAEALARYLRDKFDNLDDKQSAILNRLIKTYRNNVFAPDNIKRHFKNDRKKAEDFLEQKPFIFADAVHAGNKEYPITENETNDRILRNQLGGSLILCGASKLTEGYDNPQIEIAFMLRPYRRANITLFQELGRILRRDPDNPEKIALAVQFIWDDRQLLLSSPDLLGMMSYGLDHELTFKRDTLSKGPDYTVRTTMSTELVSGPRGTGKRRQIGHSEEPAAKKRKSANPEKLSSAAELTGKLLSWLRRLEAKLKHFSQVTSNKPPVHQDAVLPPSSSRQLEIPKNFRDLTLVASDGQTSVEAPSENAAALLNEVGQLITKLNSMLPQPMPDSLPDRGQKWQPKKPKEEYDVLKRLKQMLDSARIIGNRAERAFVRSQMVADAKIKDANPNEEIEEIDILVESELKISKDQVVKAEPLLGLIENAVNEFATKSPDQLFDRRAMRVFFRECVWNKYLALPKHNANLGDSTFADLIVALLQQFVTEKNATKMLGKVNNQTLWRIYKDIEMVKLTLQRLYHQYDIEQPMELEEPALLLEPTAPPFQAISERELNPMRSPTKRISSESTTEKKMQPYLEGCEIRIKRILDGTNDGFCTSDYEFLEECVPSSGNVTKKYIITLSKYVEFLYGMNVLKFKNNHNFINLINFYEDFHLLKAEKTDAQERLKMLLGAIGASSQDLNLGAYAVALAKTNLLGSSLSLLKIQIIRKSLMIKDNDGKFAIEYLNPMYHRTVIEHMYSVTNRNETNRGAICLFRPGKGNYVHHQYFINNVRFNDPASVRMAIIAVNDFRYHTQGHGEAIIGSYLTPQGVGLYLACRAIEFIEMRGEADITIYRDLFNAVSQWYVAEPQVRQEINKVADGLINWTLAKQYLKPEIINDLQAIFNEK